MNFEGKSTFKRKWKQFGSLTLRYERKSTKENTCFARRRVYTVSAWWNAFKLGFLPSKHQSFSWKISLSLFSIGPDQLYIGCAGGRSISKYVPFWRSGNKMPWREVLSSITGKAIFLFYFFSFLFFPLFVLFFGYYSFVLFCFFMQRSFLINKFSSLLPNFTFFLLATSCRSRGPAIHVF